MSGRVKAPGDHPVRTQLLLGLYPELLGPRRLLRGLRLPAVPTELHPEASARQEHHAGRRGGEVQRNGTPSGRRPVGGGADSKFSRSGRRGVRRLRRQKEQSHQVVLGLFGLVLRRPRPAALRVRRF